MDVRVGELRNQGVRIKLQEQPLLVLKVLLGRPGEIVTRDELRSQIWSADTFVDFDNSLNTAINKLREALGDSAQSPRFIETLPRKGYRFIAPVTSGNGKESASHGADVAAAAQRWRVFLPVAVILVTVPRPVGTRRHHSHPTMHRELLIGGIQIRIVATGSGDGRLGVIGHR